MTEFEGPEEGADKFRDNWVPTPFVLKTFDAESMTYIMEFELPKQLLLADPNWQALVHDEVLRYADRDGVMLTGQIVITERDGGYRPYPKDPTEERDASVQDVLLDKEKEADVEEAQQDMPIKMSEKELDFRKRLRHDLRDTADTAFGFMQGQVEGRPLPGGREMRLDRSAFMEGFFGGAPGPVRSEGRDVMIVKAEAMVASFVDLQPAEFDPKAATERLIDAAEDEDAIDRAVAEIEIPDDLSGLDN